jgi:5'-3' exoribonuclease 2
MGIPVYFKTIIENNKQCICRPKIVDNLLFDLNCLIHPCCANETDEKVMFNNIYEKINDIIDLVKPKYIYIAVDGPCPMPKIKQQRQRRFQSAKQNKKWDTNAITPGTKFMNKLDNFLTKHFYWKPNIELSLSSIPGEGEQKIFHHIKNKSLNNNVVYGLDADLIMLSIINDSKISLLRERTNYNIECVDDEYIYLDIDILKSSLDMSPEDYIFICFFIGNDFIKNTPSINIRYDGLDVLLNTYKLLKNKYGNMFYLINRYEKNFINYNYFKEYIKELSKNEKSRLETIIKIRDKQQSKILNRTLTYDEKKLHEPIINRNDEKEIFKNMDDWRIKYYKYFNIDGEKNVDLLCKNYIESYIWTINYYLKGCINWSWSYNYHFGPSLYDLVKYLEKNKSFDIETDIETDTNIITPYKQLQLVLPESSFNLSKRKLNKNRKLNYPDELIKCTLLKRYDWESIIINL